MSKKYVINGVEFIDDGDIDLEKESIYDAKGERITNTYIDNVIEEIHQVRGVGRPSLGGKPAPSPQVAFRIPEELRQAAVARAKAEGKTVSALAREALERLLLNA